MHSLNLKKVNAGVGFLFIRSAASLAGTIGEIIDNKGKTTCQNALMQSIKLNAA